MDEKRLDEIRKRAEAATPGPWEWSQEFRNLKSADGRPILSPEGFGTYMILINSDNSDFIAHARQDIPDLLAALEAAEQHAAFVEAQFDELKIDLARAASRTLFRPIGSQARSFVWLLLGLWTCRKKWYSGRPGCFPQNPMSQSDYPSGFIVF